MIAASVPVDSPINFLLLSDATLACCAWRCKCGKWVKLLGVDYKEVKRKIEEKMKGRYAKTSGQSGNSEKIGPSSQAQSALFLSNFFQAVCSVHQPFRFLISYSSVYPSFSHSIYLPSLTLAPAPHVSNSAVSSSPSSPAGQENECMLVIHENPLSLSPSPHWGRKKERIHHPLSK